MTGHESRLEAEREARDMRTRILWAGCILNGAGLLALVQLVSQVDDPDYALGALRWSFVMLACGLAVGGFSRAVNYIGLLNRHLWMTAKHSAGNPDNTPMDKAWWEAKQRSHFAREGFQGQIALYVCMVGFTLGVAGILLGVFGSLNGHRLQPRDQSQTPERVMQAINLLQELTTDEPTPSAVSGRVKQPATPAPQLADVPRSAPQPPAVESPAQ